MNRQTKPTVKFLKVTDNTTKIRRLASTVQQHFLSGDKIVVFAPNKQATDYIDQLLWRMPSDGFLPHAIANGESSERVVITESKENINQANIAINLTPGLLTLDSFEIVYELMDGSDPKKVKQVQEKMREYQKLGLY